MINNNNIDVIMINTFNNFSNINKIEKIGSISIKRVEIKGIKRSN